MYLISEEGESRMVKEKILNLFSSAELTLAGRPKLNPENDEVEVLYVEKVNIETVNKERIFYNCNISVTNMRVFVIPPSDERTGRALHLRDVSRFTDNAGVFRSSRRITAHAKDGIQFHIRFNDKNKDLTLEMLGQYLQRKAWDKCCKSEMKDSRIATEGLSQISTRHAGVSGLKRRQQEEQNAEKIMASDALSDLESLMTRAGEVVAIVKKYSTFRFDKPDDESETSSIAADASEMETILQDIGILSPVTKLSAGRQYYQLLSRQVADLLHEKDRIRRLGGVVSLTDLYCLYNRARGTELVSPDDLLQAVRLMESLRLGLKLRSFSSGVLVLQDDSLSDETMCNRLLEFAVQNPDTGINPSMVASKFRLSILVAKEQLLFAETSQVLCRDDTLNGIFFFHNAFSVY